MANEEQLAILHQGVGVWNKWREENPNVRIDLSNADLIGAQLQSANLTGTDLWEADLTDARLNRASLVGSRLYGADLLRANLDGAILNEAYLDANLDEAILSRAELFRTDIRGASLVRTNFSGAVMFYTIFGSSDLSLATGLNNAIHEGPTSISIDTLALSKGKISEVFLRGCGLSDVDIEYTKLFNPKLNNEEINKILYKIYDLRATQAMQISPLFISYSHANTEFVNKLEVQLNKKGIRFWRDIHDMKSGRMETQIDRAIRQNPTVLLVLSEDSLSSDWVEHEVRTARQLEKDVERDVLCPVALDDSWKSSRWPARIMEQIKEYNILDFSEWRDDVKFERMFRKLIDGLELFYKG